MGKKLRKKYGLPDGWRITVRGRIFKDGQLLIGQRRCSKKVGNWTLPGGRPKQSDRDLRAALAREIEEETGLLVFVDKLVAVITIPEQRLVVEVYDCIPVGGEIGVIPKKWRGKPELAQLKGIVSLGEVDSLLLTERQRQEIACALSWQRGQPPILLPAQLQTESGLCGENLLPTFIYYEHWSFYGTNFIF